MISVLVLIIIVLILLIIYLISKISMLRQNVDQLMFDNRSMNVKHGKNWEHFVPFTKEFPGSKENFRFIGNPIDGVVFDDDEIKFIEVKTGKSSLNQKQRKIRDLVKKKRVKWYELRYGK